MVCSIHISHVTSTSEVQSPRSEMVCDIHRSHVAGTSEVQSPRSGQVREERDSIVRLEQMVETLLTLGEYCCVLQWAWCVTVCCSVLQCVAVSWHSKKIHRWARVEYAQWRFETWKWRPPIDSRAAADRWKLAAREGGGGVSIWFTQHVAQRRAARPPALVAHASSPTQQPPKHVCSPQWCAHRTYHAHRAYTRTRPEQPHK